MSKIYEKGSPIEGTEDFGTLTNLETGEAVRLANDDERHRVMCAEEYGPGDGVEVVDGRGVIEVGGVRCVLIDSDGGDMSALVEQDKAARIARRLKRQREVAAYAEEQAKVLSEPGGSALAALMQEST